MESNQTAPWRALIALVLFGVSFGYVEAAVVVYLRDVYEPLALRLHPERASGELFPLITLDQLEAAGGTHMRLPKTEVAREAATMVMLAAAGLAIARNFNTFFAGFVIAFGVWDIFYYVFLKVLIDWPTSLLEWDVLFLIPVPWVGPVLAPVLVALSMIAAGTLLLWRESTGRPVHIGWRRWCIIVLGGLIIIGSFCRDYRQVMADGRPNPFSWPMFLAGEIVGLVGFLLAVIAESRSGHRNPEPRDAA